MTGITVNWPLFSWPFKATKTTTLAPEPPRCDAHQDLRRAYVAEMIVSGACVGEYGAQALMAVFPRDF